MEHFRIEISGNACLTAYLHRPSPKMPLTAHLPAILIFPGGGYEFCSEREGEPIAMSFLAQGFQAFVLEYSTGKLAKEKAPLLDAATALLEIRRNAKRWRIHPQKIVTLGFSAGGHLAGWLGNCYNDKALCRKLQVTDDEIKPNAQILCYPVITAGIYRHQGSFQCLFGEETSLYQQASLENLVSSQTPPTFLWTCSDDQSVHNMNSLLYAESLSKARVPFELHVFQGGGHGLALANKLTAREYKHAEDWVTLCLKWLKLIDIVE